MNQAHKTKDAGIGSHYILSTLPVSLNLTKNKIYERFATHFHNSTIQENIRNSKDEQNQGEFLIDLFVHEF